MVRHFWPKTYSYLEGYSNGVGDVAVSPDGQTLVSSDSSDIKVWNLRTGQLLRTLEGHKFLFATL